MARPVLYLATDSQPVVHTIAGTVYQVTLPVNTNARKDYETLLILIGTLLVPVTAQVSYRVTT